VRRVVHHVYHLASPSSVIISACVRVRVEHRSVVGGTLFGWCGSGWRGNGHATDVPGALLGARDFACLFEIIECLIDGCVAVEKVIRNLLGRYGLLAVLQVPLNFGCCCHAGFQSDGATSEPRRRPLRTGHVREWDRWPSLPPKSRPRSASSLDSLRCNQPRPTSDMRVGCWARAHLSWYSGSSDGGTQPYRRHVFCTSVATPTA